MILKSHHILLLGGTEQARDLCQQLSSLPSLHLYYSQAKHLTMHQIPTPQITYHYGGFRQYHSDSLSGLCHFLRHNQIDLIIDVTHPYAQQISATAQQASKQLQIPLWAYHRQRWPDLTHQHRFDSLTQLWNHLPPKSRPFLTSGHQELGALSPRPDVDLVWRGIVRAKNSFLHQQGAIIILNKGPFCLQSETDLLIKHQITHLISKESGGPIPAKITAAQALSLPIWTLRLQDIYQFPPLSHHLYWRTNDLSQIIKRWHSTNIAHSHDT